MAAKKILTVAESDSCGGSGIQADIKTIMALGGYASSAITSVTAQNTQGIQDVVQMDPAFVVAQMRAAIGDIGVDAIKVGLLGSIAMIDRVADVLDQLHSGPCKVVLDPSMVARDGSVAMDQDTISALKRRLLVRATAVTPNRREAELLTGMTISDLDGMRHAADMMLTLGAEIVILKGGPISGEKLVDLVATLDGDRTFETAIIPTQHTQGAGATLSSALAVCLAEGMDAFSAMQRSLEFLNRSIASAHGFGKGAGPINQAHMITRARAEAA